MSVPRPKTSIASDRTIVWDNHVCMPLDPGNLSEMAALERFRDAGINVISLNVSSGDQSQADALGMLSAFRFWIEQRPDHYMLVATASDAERAKASGRLGICFDIEGMSVLEERIESVQRYYDLGVRWMLTAYNHRNAAGGGCLDEPDNGLTKFGRAVVREMNRVGMVVCGSHAGYRTARELIDESSQPVIFSHSNPRAMWNSMRNIPDDLMRACAGRGGVVGLNGIGPFLGARDIGPEIFVRHVEYALDLIGEDHVGIALDYCFGDEQGLIDFMALYPALFSGYQNDGQGLNMIEPWRIGEITDLLQARGVKEATLAKLLGGNHMRIARSVWR